MIAWNQQFNCAVDDMGMPISLSQARQAIALLEAHLKNTPEHLAVAVVSIGNSLYPEMAHNIAYDPEAMR